MHIITRMIRGGAQQVVLDLLRGQKQAGLDLVFVAGEQTGPEGSLWSEVENLGIETVHLPFLVREISPIKDLRALHALRQVIRRYRPQVVHSHTSKAGFIGCLAARREDVPLVVLAPHGHILGKDAGIQGVPGRGIKRWILSKIAMRNSMYAHVVIAPNESERSDGIMLGLWSTENSVVIPNGVDTDLFRPRYQAESRKKLGVEENGFLVGVVARLTKEKGVDFAVQTISEIPDVRLVIVGDGPEFDSLRNLSLSLGVSDRVKFAGLKTGMEEIYPAFDVCLVPSRTEAHGMAAAESSACRIPVVASNVGGLRSVVLHEKTGLLVHAGDVAGYRDAIIRLAGNPDLVNDLAKAGRAHIAESFSSTIMVSRMLELYRKLLGVRVKQTSHHTDLQR